MKVTTKDLKDKNACPEATEWFEEEFDGVLECEWTRENQIALIKDTDAHKYFGWAVRNTLVSEWAMSGSNFGNADLRDANLRSANLRIADLRDANLRHADLRHADLRDARTNEYTKFPEGFDKEGRL